MTLDVIKSNCCFMCCSSTQRRRAFAGRHVFVLASSSSLRGHKRTYRTILESEDHAFLKIVRYVLLRPLGPELDAKTKTCLPAKTRFCHLDEQANRKTRPKYRAGDSRRRLVVTHTVPSMGVIKSILNKTENPSSPYPQASLY
jgi:hypothetical protein